VNQTLYGFGDAVAVPAVQWLAANYLMPLVRGTMPTLALPNQASENHDQKSLNTAHRP
jgi:DNA (cytosine-5)-methyltransferase 1